MEGLNVVFSEEYLFYICMKSFAYINEVLLSISQVISFLLSNLIMQTKNSSF